MNFEMKILEFIDSMNDELKQIKKKWAKQNKLIKWLMRQEVEPSSSTKKLAKVYFPNTFFGFRKAKKVKEFLLKMDNCYDVQKPKAEDKISIAVTFLKDHILQ